MRRRVATGAAASGQRWSWWLRDGDQTVLCLLLSVGMLALLAWWRAHQGHLGRLAELDIPAGRSYEFRVDVNRAGWPELSLLPGIGETLGRRIVEDRERNGPFRSPDELQRVRGIGPRTVQRMKPYLAASGDGGTRPAGSPTYP